ncbi:telomerase RNA component interacting RNase-like [Saccoglossus kowalevskii]|uniref:Uncharacterized protein C19orf43-like n=1 Tax=Saccoglossus kowalevskii TaxID=10224 RepID=A0ABM0GX89_SACKO|nr:PREDICTED: uncharacterized protein C19orf43-like [Saccoglossus kowalevskii]
MTAYNRDGKTSVTKTPTSDAEEDEKVNKNAFTNDGSFMELFKKKIEQEQRRKATNKSEATSSSSTTTPADTVVFTANQTSEETSNAASTTAKKSRLNFFVGKRKGLTLKTGQVKKQKPDDKLDTKGKTSAWTEYMAEVQKYKATSCADEDKTRPLVK